MNKPTHKVTEGLFCTSADVCMATYQWLNPLAQILKGLMVLSLCLDAATDPLSRFCMRSGDKWQALVCTSKGNSWSHPSLFPSAGFSVQRIETHLAEK